MKRRDALIAGSGADASTNRAGSAGRRSGPESCHLPSALSSSTAAGTCAVFEVELPMVAAQVPGRLPASPLEVTAMLLQARMRASTVSTVRHCVSSVCSSSGDASVSLKVRHLVSRHGLDVPKSG